MWKSPIEIQIEAAQTELIEKEEQLILNTVQSVIGRVINKQQLIDALNHDSAQYSKGYIDGLMNAKKQIIAAVKDMETVYHYYWQDEVINAIEEAVPGQPIDPLDSTPPDDCDYETGYDPFLGCTTDDC